jgi:hypothetical protein
MRFRLWKIDQPNNKTYIFFPLPNVRFGCGRRLGKNFLTLLQHWSGKMEL